MDNRTINNSFEMDQGALNYHFSKKQFKNSIEETIEYVDTMEYSENSSSKQCFQHRSKNLGI